jgi:hypothetical protein
MLEVTMPDADGDCTRSSFHRRITWTACAMFPILVIGVVTLVYFTNQVLTSLALLPAWIILGRLFRWLFESQRTKDSTVAFSASDPMLGTVERIIEVVFTRRGKDHQPDEHTDFGTNRSATAEKPTGDAIVQAA